jgi:DNA sulfur modification protein DndD
MILERLRLSNFGLYRGEQTLMLSPVMQRGRSAPVVLFGGVNGGGKTTILDAVQLVLYGNRARCSKRTDKPYEDFLRQSIHQSVDAGTGASIALTFRYATEGEQHQYEVSRHWNEYHGKVRERVEVMRDGVADGWLSENWSQLVEEIIPNGIAQLCFFDAEKIRHLAEDESSTRALGDAIKSLLGLDLAERLVADAAVLEGKLARRGIRSTEVVEAARIEGELLAKQQKVDRMVQELGGLENARAKATAVVRGVEDEFSKAGGQHWLNREAMQRKLGEITQSVKDSENRLIGLAGTELPLLLVRDLLTAVDSRAAKEKDATETSLILRLLEERDSSIVEFLKQQRVKASSCQAVQEFLALDRSGRGMRSVSDVHSELSEASRVLLRHLLQRVLDEHKAVVAETVHVYDRSRQSLEDIDRNLAMTPGDEQIRVLAERLKLASEELGQLDQQVTRITAELGAIRTDRDLLEKKLRDLRRKVVDEQIQSEEDSRVGKLLLRTKTTMTEFLRKATARKIDSLSELVTDSFKFLLGKELLVERVVICPHEFTVDIIGKSGQSMPKGLLSEGEKQIFAISLLWGLSRASARPLPTIIDTPMGRLDEKHRDRLVSRYFPNASHQVILLSTDTEIDRYYFSRLQPHLSRVFHLRYDEAERMTVAEEGYFWSESHEGRVRGKS